VVKGTDLDVSRRVEQSLKALVMKREGYAWQEIADRLAVSVVEAQEFAKIAYGQMAIDTAENLRLEVEDRIDSIVRKAHLDLSLSQSQGERTALYRVLLAAEAQRSRLLGLELPKGAPDA
jgi:hypothetical protein